MTATNSFDLILVGGGLANGLIAYRLRHLRPQLRLLLVEQGETLGGNHSWSFCEPDLEPEQRQWIEPFVEHRWDSYEVRFPQYSRIFETRYFSFSSKRFHEILCKTLGEASFRTSARVARLDPDQVVLDDGQELRSACVIDGRGGQADSNIAIGYQKFSGRVLRLAQPHGLRFPILMDATVDQEDGYRFMYVLPLTATELLLEDTCYSATLDLDSATDHQRISCYAQGQGWEVAEVIRDEAGVLPITLGGDIQAFWNQAGKLPRSGLRAQLFHATTGYSLPEAMRCADLVAAEKTLTSASLGERIQAHSKALWRRQRYFRLLSRLLIGAADPPSRFLIMQKFYRLDRKLVERFYAGKLTFLDQLRILSGKPPVSLRRALSCLYPPSSGEILGELRS